MYDWQTQSEEEAGTAREEENSVNIKTYNPDEIELKWQRNWADAHAFEAKTDKSKPKFFGLIEFPYPSGAGLHVGHPRSNTAMDIISRKRRHLIGLHT